MRISELINPDIVDPNFHAEKQIDTSVGKLTLVAKNIAAGNVPQFVVNVMNDEGKSIGYFRFVVADYRPDKKLFGFKIKSKSDPYVVGGNISVWREFQRKGIATQVYKFVRELGNDIKPSTRQTADGKAFWDSGAANK